MPKAMFLRAFFLSPPLRLLLLLVLLVVVVMLAVLVVRMVLIVAVRASKEGKGKRDNAHVVWFAPVYPVGFLVPEACSRRRA